MRSKGTTATRRLAISPVPSKNGFCYSLVSQQMKAALSFALLLITGQPLMADQFEVIGRFNDVTSADGGEHCGGYSLDLWETKGRLLGLFHKHSGLCGDPPCSVIKSASLDRASGRLRFNATIGEEKLAFLGSIASEHVTGKLNGRPTRLKREAQLSGFEPDTNLRAWCSFWESVPRCTGVKELCDTLR